MNRKDFLASIRAGSPLALCALVLALALPLAAAAATPQFLVTFKASSVSSQSAARSVAKSGGTVVQDFSEIGIVLASSSAPNFAATLAQDSSVLSVGAEVMRQAAQPLPATSIMDGGVAPVQSSLAATSAALVTDPTTATFYSFQWSLPRIEAPEVWATGNLGSPKVTVAMIDTGVDYTHPELVGKVDLARSISLVPEEDAVIAATFPGMLGILDLSFHGTYNASIVACNARGIACVAPNVNLVAVKALDAASNTTAGRVVAAIMYASRLHAQVINMSFSLVYDKTVPADVQSIRAIDRAVAMAIHRGAAMTAQAGVALGAANADDFPNLVIEPAQSGALGVSASDRDDQLSNITDWGSHIVDIAAPTGTFTGSIADATIGACSSFGRLVPACDRVHPTDPYHYVFLTGYPATSPMVAGVAALLASTRRHDGGGWWDDGHDSNSVRGRKIMKTLLRTAIDIGPKGRDPFFGAGRVDALRAINGLHNDRDDNEDDD